jgi:hypothetical protein
MSTDCSALWSSLRTLELTSQFTSTPVEPAKYHSSIFGDRKDHKRHQKLASALAHIGASSSDAKTVTACSVELLYPEGGGNPIILLRVAQNKRVQREEIAQLQRLVDGLVEEVSTLDECDWSTQDGAFFILSRYHYSNCIYDQSSSKPSIQSFRILFSRL